MKTRDDQIRQKTRVWVFWICINVYVYKYVLSVFSLSEVFFYCLCWDIQFVIKQNIYTQSFVYSGPVKFHSGRGYSNLAVWFTSFKWFILRFDGIFLQLLCISGHFFLSTEIDKWNIKEIQKLKRFVFATLYMWHDLYCVPRRESHWLAE